MRRTVLVTMCAGYFLVLLDVTVVNVALPSIARGLHADVDGLQWVVDGYAIALASLMLFAGTVGDLHGHKRVVLWGLAVFGAASAGCAASSSVAMLVALRALQGLGAALMLPGTLAVVTNAFPGERERARAIGVWAGIGSAALAAGPVLGGLARGVDPVVLAAAAAALLAAGFVASQASRPGAVLPLELFRARQFSAANAIAGTMNLATLGLLFVLTLYLQVVQHRSALAAGLALLPLFLPLSVLAPVGGRLTSRVGPRVPMAAGLLSATVGVALLAGAGADTDYVALLPALLLWGAGLAVLTPSVVAAAVAAVPAERAGLGAAVNNTARQAGGAVGIAAFGALAGSPRAGAFVAGFHLAALVAAALFAAAAVASVALIPARSA